MRRYFLINLFLFLLANNVTGQEMREVFLSAPDSIFPTMTANNRLDLVDFINSNMTARITSRLSSEICLDSLSEEYLKLRENSHEVEMGLVPLSDSLKVVVIVDKVLAPAVDSRISYYLKNWTPYQGSGFLPESVPELHSLRIRDFLSVPENTLTTAQEEILRRLEDISLFDASLDVQGKCLVVGVSTGRLNKEERQEISSLFGKKRFNWIK